MWNILRNYAFNFHGYDLKVYEDGYIFPKNKPVFGLIIAKNDGLPKYCEAASSTHHTLKA